MNLKRWGQQRYQKLKELTTKYLDTSTYFCLHGEQIKAHRSASTEFSGCN